MYHHFWGLSIKSIGFGPLLSPGGLDALTAAAGSLHEGWKAVTDFPSALSAPRVLTERLDLAAIRRLASLRATRIVSMRSLDVNKDVPRPETTLRRTLYEYLLRADDRGDIVTLATERKRVPMRLYTGLSDLSELPATVSAQFSAKAKEHGLSNFVVTKGTFNEPRCIRGLLRGHGVAVDQTKSHLYAQLSRHPVAPCLQQDLANASAIHPRILPDDAKRDDICKPLFRAMMYGAGDPVLADFFKNNKVADESFLQCFKTEQAALRQVDAAAYPDLLKRLLENGHDKHKAPITLQSILNERYERAVAEKVEEAVADLGNVAGLEHDGRWVQPVGPVDDRWHVGILEAACTVAPHKIDLSVDYDAAVKQLADRAPHLDSTAVDDGWEVAEKDAQEVNVRLRLGQSHFGELAAKVVAAHLVCVNGRMLRVDEIFKFVPGSKEPDFMQYDQSEQIWATEMGSTGVRGMNRIASDCLKVCLGEYKCLLPESVYNPAILSAIIGSMQPLLYDLQFYFKLDGDHSREFLCYSHGIVEHRDTKVLMQSEPEYTVSRCTGYPYPRAELEELNKQLLAKGVNLAEVLTDVKTQEAFLGVSVGRFVEIPADANYTAGLIAKLDIIADVIPGLRDLWECHSSWLVTVFLLKQFARARYAREVYEEIMTWLGEMGQNGKGLWYAVMKLVFGSYAHEPKPELFTQPPPAEGPTPFFLNIRGRRLLLTPELEADHEVLVGLLKRLRDQSASIEGRGLFKGSLEFRPQHLQVFSSNVVPSLSSYDGGVQRSFTCVDFPFHFCERPDASAGQKLLKQNLQTASHLRTLVAGMDLLLRAFDVAFTSNSKSTVVQPRPAVVSEATEKLLDAQQGTMIRDFVKDHLGKVAWDLASTRPQVIKALMTEFKDQLGQGRKGTARTGLSLRAFFVEVRVNGRDLLQWKGCTEFAIIKPR